MDDEASVQIVQALNEQNRPLASWPGLGGQTATQLQWVIGGAASAMLLYILLAFMTAWGLTPLPGALHVPLYLALLVGGELGRRWNRDGVEHVRKAQLRYLLRRHTRVPWEPGERAWTRVERTWSVRGRVLRLPWLRRAPAPLDPIAPRLAWRSGVAVVRRGP